MQGFYDEWEKANKVVRHALMSAIDTMFISKSTVRSNGFERIARCRQALVAIDGQGWERSFHQREFHDAFIRSCARVFWKTERQGQFARDHQQILQTNGWDHLCQEILVSTPRRCRMPPRVSLFTLVSPV
jgi:hypothetical protein